jgi:hypothetical protein
LGGVSVLGTAGEDFVLAQDETVFTDGAGLCAGVDAWGAEKARRSATELRKGCAIPA